MSTADKRYVDSANTRWYSAKTGQTFPLGGPPPPPSPEFGPVVYTPGEIDSWAASGAAYTELSGSTRWSTTFRTPTDHGTSVTTSASADTLYLDGLYCKVQAIRYAVLGTAGSLTVVNNTLDGIKDITSWSTGTPGQDALEISWGLVSMLQAARIVGYPKATLDTTLRNVFYPKMDWSTGGNWFAGFAANKLAIASYLEDEDLWNDAMAYTLFRLGQCVYHSTYDSTTIYPILGSSHNNRLWPVTTTGSPSASATASHWYNAVTTSPFTATEGGTPWPDGVDCERERDQYHTNMGMVGWLYCALTMRAVGVAVPTEIHERIREQVNHHAERILQYANTGTIPNPQPASFAGTVWKHGWVVAKRYLGNEASSDVDDLMVNADIIDGVPYGINHIVAERFADGTLI